MICFGNLKCPKTNLRIFFDIIMNLFRIQTVSTANLTASSYGNPVRRRRLEIIIRVRGVAKVRICICNACVCVSVRL